MYGSNFVWGYAYPRGYMAAGLGYPYGGYLGYPCCGWGYPGLGYGYGYGYPYVL